MSDLTKAIIDKLQTEGFDALAREIETNVPKVVLGMLADRLERYSIRRNAMPRPGDLKTPLTTR
jgi:hypothetical protein